MKVSFLQKFNLSSALRRFPFSLVTSFFIGVIIIYLIESTTPTDPALIRLLHVLFIGFSASTLLHILDLRYNISTKVLALGFCGIVLFSVIYYFSLPQYPLAKHFIQTVGIILCLHLLMSFLPHWKDEDKTQFWAYNKTLFLRFLETSFFTLFIFASLSLALLALEKLFGLNLSGAKIYGDLFVLLAASFHPIYFFSRFPEDLHFDKEELDHGKAYGLFSEKILVPIVSLYATILLAYILKIIGLWSWPRGWVSNMVLWFSVFGIFAYLLNYIKLDTCQPKYIAYFKKYYFQLQGIFAIVLLAAINRRLQDYGLTEPRYIVAMLGLWLFLISMYFTISKTDNIKWIPASLSLCVLIACVGPFSMENASVNSQFKRLKRALSENQVLVGNALGKVSPDQKDLQSIVSEKLRFLNDRNALQKLHSFESDEVSFPKDIINEDYRFAGALVYESSSKINLVKRYAKAMGFEYDNSVLRLNDGNTAFFHANTRGLYNFSIRGYDEMHQLRCAIKKAPNQKITPSYFDLDTSGSFLIYSTSADSVSIPLAPLAIKYDLLTKNSPRLDSLRYSYSDTFRQYDFYLENISGSVTNKIPKFEFINGFVLIKHL